MKRKTNIFYTDGPDSKFLTFSNYTESLTGNFLSTDTKLYPSMFLCLNINNLDKKEFINNYLTGYYENKLAFLRDHFLEKDKDLEENICPLGYLLDTIKNFDPNFTITYVGDITEQDYNGTYTDTICTISFANYYKGTYSLEAQSELDDNYIEYPENSLYGWKGNELVMIITPQIKNTEIICKYRGNGNTPVNLYQDLPNLKYIKIDDKLYNIDSSNNPFYKDNDDNDRCYCTFNDYNNHIVTYIFNNNVDSIAGDAFYESQLISIILPASVTLIGQNAFENCINLISITCNAINAPIFEYGPNTFGNTIQNNGILYVRENARGYNTWMEQLGNGWGEKNMKENIQPIFDKDNNKYCIKSNINKLTIEKNTNDSVISFNIIIPLFDVQNINYHTQHYITENIELNENDKKIIELNNVKDYDLYRKYVPLGIWFADETITLKKDSNNIFSQSWSLLISSQFKPFPYSKASVNDINENSVSNAYPTFAMILSRQNEILNQFSEISKLINQQTERISTLETKINNMSTSSNIDKINNELINFENTTNNKIDVLKQEMKEFMNNFIWNAAQ